MVLTPLNAAYVRQWTGSALVQVTACWLFGAMTLPEQMLAYCQLDSQEQISLKKIHLKMSYARMAAILSTRDD